jgi:hypothetical protein
MKDIPFIIKVSFIFILALYGGYCVFRPAEWHLIDGVNLVIHEAGHLLFGYFGQFLGVAGGTIGQLFVPAVFTIYFYYQQSRFSSSVTFFWFGQNFINISVYVKDAQAMALPLVSVGGGGDVIHDWNYLLSKMGLLARDQLIGNTVYSIGILIMLTAVILGFLLSLDNEEDRVDVEPDERGKS